MGDIYYLAGRPDVIGGKRIVCPVCAGSGRVLVPVQINEQPVECGSSGRLPVA
jgi:hypothetical protein